MSDLLSLLSWIPLCLGVFFFLAGTFGVLRFPDVFSRLHAVTKADTLGLGLIVLGLSMRATHWYAVGVMLVIWLLMMTSSAVSCQLLARFERELTSTDPKDDAHDRS